MAKDLHTTFCWLFLFRFVALTFQGIDGFYLANDIQANSHSSLSISCAHSLILIDLFLRICNLRVVFYISKVSLKTPKTVNS